MSVLFPLFFAAAAAVIAPILLHLLRQRARNVQPFSSLMFLRPSPPRMQPRTRVENLPLLLLRCLALILLAIAFARPLWQDLELITAGQKGRTLILLDTSASMSRSGLWDQALAHLDQAISDPKQRVAIVAFDRTLRPLLAFEDWAGQPAAARVELARARARSVTPGSAGTDIALALAGAADLISDDETAVPEAQGIKRIVLISDLQAGRGLDALRSATWPKGLGLSIRQVSSTQPTNAGLSLVTVAAGLMPEADDKRPRVRVSNDAASKSQSFTVAWSDGVGAPENVSVPPGSTRVMRAPVRPAGKPGSVVVLRGDDHAFDNMLYLTDAAPAEVPVLYLGNDPVDDPTGLSYFLKHALQPTRLLAPRLSINGLGNQAEALNFFNWVVVGGTPSAAMAEQLTSYVSSGGAITVVLRQASDAAWLEKLAGHPLRAEEARVNGFAMIGRVDFTHPLLRPFEVARFGDFTKIHVWHHRTVTPPPTAQVLAWYDDGQPAWFELPVGKGRVLVFTSGWHPADSQLALSTKFVPLIYTELQRSGRITPRPTQVIIGDASSLPPGTQSITGPLVSADALAAAATPSGAANPAPAIAQQGLYRVQTAEGGLLVAANIDPLESHTAPLALETLEALGVSITDADAVSAAAAAETARTSERRLKTAELEARQKSWLWILAAAFLVLITETIVAGLASRPKADKAGTPGDAVATEVVATGAAS